MPSWVIPERIYEIPRNIALLDTNVLISFVDHRDNNHENTVAVIEMNEYRWAVLYSNIVEAWNFLVGRLRRPDEASRLLGWILTPGQAIIIDEPENIVQAYTYTQKYSIDIVDAILLDVADRITRECGIHPAIHVATYDSGDFLRLFGARISFNVYDMRDASSTADIV